MTPHELITTVEAALARPGRRPLLLTVPVLRLLDREFRGRLIPADPANGPTPALYSYSRRQCRSIVKTIERAARDDLHG